MAEIAFPWHEQFQLQVAAYLWRYQGALALHEPHFKAEYISSSTTAVLVTFMLEHYRKYRTVPAEATMRELIRQAHPQLNDTTDERKRKALDQKLDELKAASTEDIGIVKDKIGEFVRFVAVRNVLMEAKDGLLKNEYDPGLPEKVRSALHAGSTEFEIGHVWRRETEVRVREATDPSVDPRIPTGLPHLDAMIGGGLQAGELGVLLALPKHFKSGTMLNFAYSAMRQSVERNVAYITLELSERLVGTRFDLRCSLLTKEQMQADPEFFLDTLRERMDLICGNNELIIKAFKTKGCTGDVIRTWMDQMYAQHDIKIDFLVVDYLDLMKSSRKLEHEYSEAVHITEDLRSIASKQEYNLPIWTACRATKEAVGARRINMRHMSKAFERVGVADMVLALCMTEEEKFKGEMRIVPVAMRNDAGDRIVDCRVDYSKMLLTSVSTSEPDYESEEDERKTRRSKKKDGDQPHQENQF